MSSDSEGFVLGNKSGSEEEIEIQNENINVQAKEIVDDAVNLFFYAHGLPFHLAWSPYFKDAFEKVREAASLEVDNDARG